MDELSPHGAMDRGLQAGTKDTRIKKNMLRKANIKVCFFSFFLSPLPSPLVVRHIGFLRARQ